LNEICTQLWLFVSASALGSRKQSCHFSCASVMDIEEVFWKNYGRTLGSYT
jgi:hypothetical protein